LIKFFRFFSPISKNMKVVACVVVAGAVADGRGCDFTGQFADMHDGDQKNVNVRNSQVVITSNSGGTWEIDTTFDCSSKQMMVDFDVPGKADHPPVPLQATKWETSSMLNSKVVLEFNDPTGTLDYPTKPLNQWVDLARVSPPTLAACPTALDAVFADMGDGDMKRITIDGTSLTIKPSGNDQVWEVNTVLDANCQAVVDFKDSGKPAYPPVDLLATFWQATTSHSSSKAVFEFTDPSGTLAQSDAPLNHWVELPAAANVLVVAHV